MRASRLLSILIMLQIRGRVSARELADRLEVSKRTIYRDVDELSAAGVPVYADRGAAGGFALLDGWRTVLNGLTSSEADALLLSGVPAAAADLGWTQVAASARLKLLAALPAGVSEGAVRIADRFHLDPHPWHKRPHVPHEILRELSDAVWESRRIRLRYESWTGERERLLDPLGVVLKAGEWYFVARDRDRTGIYKLDKARDLTILPEQFERPRVFDLAAAWNSAVQAFEQGLRRREARLRVADSALSRLDRLGADMADPIANAVSDAEGWREATVMIESIGYAAGLILGFGCEIVVLAPAELRDELRRRAASVVALYADQTAERVQPLPKHPPGDRPQNERGHRQPGT